MPPISYLPFVARGALYAGSCAVGSVLTGIKYRAPSLCCSITTASPPEITPDTKDFSLRSRRCQAVSRAACHPAHNQPRLHLGLPPRAITSPSGTTPRHTSPNNSQPPPRTLHTKTTMPELGKTANVSQHLPLVVVLTPLTYLPPPLNIDAARCPLPDLCHQRDGSLGLRGPALFLLRHTLLRAVQRWFGSKGRRGRRLAFDRKEG